MIFELIKGERNSNRRLFYAEVSTRRAKFLVWLGSWFETLGALYMHISQGLYHRAKAHGHCARHAAVGEQANLALQDYYEWHAIRERVRNAINN